MHQLPFTMRLSLLASACALVIAGLALAAAGLTGNPGLIAAFTVLQLLVAIGVPLFLARQIKLFRLEEQDDLDEGALYEGMTLSDAEEYPQSSIPADIAPAEDEEALRRAQKAQAVDRLRDGITHDLNNRLMVISANIDAVARQMKEQPSRQRKLLSALVAADQAARLIARSTAFARQSEPQVQYVDMAERVNSVAALMSRSLLRDTVELRVVLGEELWPVKADPDDIETAIVTLSAHLRDALTQGGTITLEARNVHVQRGSLPNMALEGDFMQLTIRSTGINKQPALEDLADQALILRDVDLSSWLDYSQSVHFLGTLGGAHEVRRSGHETIVSLYLPRADAATLLPANLSNDDDGLSENAQRHPTEVLVVDDEVEVALALQSMLEEFGYVTSIATDAAQAVKSLGAHKPGLVLTDVTMPGTMSGVMLAREVRQVFPDLPILLITGNPVAVDERSEFPLLQKPIISRDLHVAIQRHLAPPDRDKVVPLFPRAS